MLNNRIFEPLTFLTFLVTTEVNTSYPKLTQILQYKFTHNHQNSVEDICNLI